MLGTGTTSSRVTSRQSSLISRRTSFSIVLSQRPSLNSVSTPPPSLISTSASSNSNTGDSNSDAENEATEVLLMPYRSKFGVYHQSLVKRPERAGKLLAQDRLPILDLTTPEGQWTKYPTKVVLNQYRRRLAARWEGGKMFNRTRYQCFQRLVYYLCLYVAVVLPIVPMGFTYRYLFMSIDRPKASSILLTEPGLNFRPRPAEFTHQNTLIQYNRNDREKYVKLIKSVNDIVKSYEPHNHTSSVYTEDMETYWTKVCTFENPADDRYACRLNTQNFGSYCYRNMEYGFPDGTPCVLIRINKIYGWVPEPYDTYEELINAGFPLRWRPEKFDPRYIPISCMGQTPVDQELVGKIKYFYPFESGKRGIPTYFFPYLNQKNFKSPGVMVHFPDLAWSVVVRVVCKLWARNVPHDREGPSMMPRGGVQFEFLIDNGIVEKWAESWPDFKAETWLFGRGRGRGMADNPWNT